MSEYLTNNKTHKNEVIYSQSTTPKVNKTWKPGTYWRNGVAESRRPDFKFRKKARELRTAVATSWYPFRNAKHIRRLDLLGDTRVYDVRTELRRIGNRKTQAEMANTNWQSNWVVRREYLTLIQTGVSSAVIRGDGLASQDVPWTPAVAGTPFGRGNTRIFCSSRLSVLLRRSCHWGKWDPNLKHRALHPHRILATSASTNPSAAHQWQEKISNFRSLTDQHINERNPLGSYPATWPQEAR